MEIQDQNKSIDVNKLGRFVKFFIRPSTISVLVSFVLCTAALARLGDVGEPIQIEGFPYIHSSTTAARDRSRIDSYGCAPSTDASGPEVVYQFSIQERGVVTADVLGDGAGVDIDLHLLRSVSTIGRQAQDCLARHNRRLSETLEQGTYFLVVDTFNGDAQVGDYRLSLKFQPEEGWYERPIAQGVTLATKRYLDLFGGLQTASLVSVDSMQPNVEVRPILASTCRTTSDIAERAGAVAAINAGYFDGACRSVSLIKIDGTMLAANARSRSAFGVSDTGVPSITWVPAGQDWQNAYHAVGGLSRLVRDGQVGVEWERDSADYGFTYYRNPRTGVAVKPTGEILLATLDGRTSAGIGVDLFDFAQWFVWLGSSDALNLDGGGSTTLWTRSEGVVNFPSDNGIADHLGERRVSSVLAVFADPVQRDVEWVVSPTIGRINVGDRVTLEIFGRDPDGEPVELRAFVSGRGAHTFYDRGDGTAQFTYDAALDDFTEIDIVFEAFTPRGRDGRLAQSWRVFGTSESDYTSGNESDDVTDAEENDQDVPDAGIVNDEVDLGGLQPDQDATGVVNTSATIDMESTRTMMEDLRDAEPYFDPDLSVPERINGQLVSEGETRPERTSGNRDFTCTSTTHFQDVLT